jgi:hypothetical protein
MPDGRDGEPADIWPALPYGPLARSHDYSLDDAEKRRRRALLAILVGLHLLLFLALRYAMDPNLSPFHILRRETVMSVEFLPPETKPLEVDPAFDVPEVSVPAVPLPVRVEPTTVPKTAPVVDTPEPRPIEAEGLSARWISADEPEPPPRIQLFNPDGSMNLSQDVIDASNATRPRGFQSPQPAPAPWERQQPAVPYDPTVFENRWKPDGESAFQEVVRRATATKAFRTPWGSTVECTWVLIMGGCGWAKPPTPLQNAPKAPEMSNPVPPPDDPPPDGG